LAEKEKVGVIIKGGLGAGELTSKFTDIPENQKREKIASLKRLADKNEVSIQEIALRFALSHPTVSTLIAGTKNPAHLKSNCEASLKGALDTSLMEQLSLSLHSE
jgi:aryl-alcohol dehydrogenase-like predicted oxidoreductase